MEKPRLDSQKEVDNSSGDHQIPIQKSPEPLHSDRFQEKKETSRRDGKRSASTESEAGDGGRRGQTHDRFTRAGGRRWGHEFLRKFGAHDWVFFLSLFCPFFLPFCLKQVNPRIYKLENFFVFFFFLGVFFPPPYMCP